MAKIIVIADHARNKILKGLNLAADTIAITAGPKGRNVILEQKNDLAPLIVNDGARIAKDISLVDPIENVGAAIIKQVALATNATAGDGTTTAVILTQAMTNLAFNLLQTTKHNPILLKQGMEMATQQVVNYLKQQARLIVDETAIVAVAKIASGNDQIAHLIAKAFQIVGHEGIVNIVLSQTFNSSLEISEGFEFQGGYLSRYMLDNNNMSEIIWNQPKIIVYNQKLHSLKPLAHILAQCSQLKQQLVIIAQDFSDDVITALAINKMKKILDVAAVKPSNYFSQLEPLLIDLSYVIDQPLIHLEQDLTQLAWEDICTIDEIKISKTKTIIIHHLVNKNNWSQHLSTLLAEQNNYDVNSKEFTTIQQRRASLTAKVALIKIGGETEIEQQERKYRIEDALHATQHALKTGVITGAGMGLLYASTQIQKPDKLNATILAGMDIIIQALQQPAIQILANAGALEKKLIDATLLTKITPKNFWLYFDWEVGKFQSSWNAGVIDPLQVCVTALTKACSISATLITTEAVVVEAREKQKFVFPNL